MRLSQYYIDTIKDKFYEFFKEGERLVEQEAIKWGVKL